MNFVTPNDSDIFLSDEQINPKLQIYSSNLVFAIQQFTDIIDGRLSIQSMIDNHCQNNFLIIACKSLNIILERLPKYDLATFNVDNARYYNRYISEQDFDCFIIPARNFINNTLQQLTINYQALSIPTQTLANDKAILERAAYIIEQHTSNVRWFINDDNSDHGQDFYVSLNRYMETNNLLPALSIVSAFIRKLSEFIEYISNTKYSALNFMTNFLENMTIYNDQVHLDIFCPYVLLALANLKQNDTWANAAPQELNKSGILDFILRNYKLNPAYTPSTFRKNAINVLKQINLIESTTDNSLTSEIAKCKYRLTESAIITITNYHNQLQKTHQIHGYRM